MRALVLGGTGLIGNAVVRELASRGYHVTALSRRPTPPANLADLAVDYVCADLDSDVPIEDRLADYSIVIDAAAPYPLHLFAGFAGRRQPIDAAARRSDRLLDALMGRDVRFGYIGLTTQRGRTEQHGVYGLQQALAHRIHPYFAVKQVIERKVLDAISRGLRAAIVHAPACIGPWDLKPRQQCWIPALIDGQILATPQQRLNVIDTRDVAASIVTAIEQKRYGEPIPLSGHNTTVEELFGLVCDTAGVAPPMWKTPASLWVLPSLWAELALAAVNRTSPVPALVPILLSEQEWREPEATQLELEVAPRPLVDTVKDTIDWYRAIGYC